MNSQAALNRRQAALWLASAAFPFAASAWPSRAAGQKISAVASFSILADWVSQVGGGRVDVTALVGPGQDAHAFSPSPASVVPVVKAQIIFVNGLGFEGWIERLIAASGAKGLLVTATRGIKPLPPKQAGGGHADHNHGHAGADPHIWHSPLHAQSCVRNIRDALSALDPAGQTEFGQNAQRYLDQLQSLDAEINAILSVIPADRRKVVTSHDAFQYFEQRYGIRFLSPAGVSSAAEPSARDMARIIRQIKLERIPAVFMENITSPALMRRIAAETGARIGGTLHSDALSAPGGPAADYVSLMRANAVTLAAALKA